MFSYSSRQCEFCMGRRSAFGSSLSSPEPYSGCLLDHSKDGVRTADRTGSDLHFAGSGPTLHSSSHLWLATPERAPQQVDARPAHYPSHTRPWLSHVSPEIDELLGEVWIVHHRAGQLVGEITPVDAAGGVGLRPVEGSGRSRIEGQLSAHQAS